MLDLHCHILPGIDDGAPDLPAALEMAQAMVALGYTHIAPSPHTGGGAGGDVSTQLNTTSRESFQQALDQAGIPLTLVANAEHCVTPTLFERLPQGATCIGNASHWLLVELPWEQVLQPETLIFRLQTKGYRVLLAHPERYSYIDIDTVERLVERGVRMQVELGSFVNVYGDRARGRAEKMVEKGLVHVLASDIHRPKQAKEWLGLALETVRKAYGEPALRRATHENPNAILKDATATALEPMTSSYAPMTQVDPKPAAPKTAAGRAKTWTAKNILRFAASLAVSLGCLYFVFRHVDFKLMMEQVKKADHRYTIAYAIATAAIQICRIYRWDILIKPFARISKRALFRISSVGFLLILALPLRLGEFARPYMLKKEAKVPMTSGLGSIVVERVVDGLLVVLLFFATTFYLDSRYTIPTAVKTSGLVAFAIFGGAALVIVTALLTHGWVPRVIARIGNPISEKVTARLLEMLDAFIIGLRALPNARALFAVIGWTVVYWAINGLGLYWMMRAFGWDVPVAAGFMLVSIVVVGIMIPAGPGFLGTFHAAILAGLSIFGIGETGAAAYGLIVYPITVGVTCAFGLPYLFAGKGSHMATEIIEESNLETA